MNGGLLPKKLRGGIFDLIRAENENKKKKSPYYYGGRFPKERGDATLVSLLGFEPRPKINQIFNCSLIFAVSIRCLDT